MKIRIREGNDFDIAWAIKRGGTPEDFTNAYDVKFSMIVYGRVIDVTLPENPFTGNVLSLNIPKEILPYTGDYRLVLEYTLPDAGQPDGDLKCKTDVVPFRIVPFTADADDVYTVNTSSDVLLGFKGDKGEDGDDAYQIWLDLGNVGTYEDFIAYLRQPAIDAGASISELEGEIQVREGLRVQAESERDLAEATRVQSENERLAAEITRQSNEGNRIDNEATRVQNEAERISKENVRQSNEIDRVEAEGVRVQAENERVQAELTRQSSESERNEAEGSRVNAESLRVTAESSRELAESLRVDAEILRQTNTQIVITNAEDATEKANTAAQNADDARLAIHDDLALKANHGYTSNPKTLKQVDDDKASHGYESNPKTLKEVDNEKAAHGYGAEPQKTLKQVDDEVIQLAGDVKDTTEKPTAQSLSELNARITALEAILTNKIKDRIDVTKEFNIWGKTNLILYGTGANTKAPDFIGQTYIDTANSNVYVAVGNSNAGNWKLV